MKLYGVHISLYLNTVHIALQCDVSILNLFSIVKMGQAKNWPLIRKHRFAKTLQAICNAFSETHYVVTSITPTLLPPK